MRAAALGALPDAALEGARRALVARIERLERRFVAAFKRRESELMHDVATARGALWPLGKRQERVLNFIPMLARQGPALVGEMRRRAAASARALVHGHGAAP